MSSISNGNNSNVLQWFTKIIPTLQDYPENSALHWSTEHLWYDKNQENEN